MLLKSQRGNQLYNTVVLGVCREYQIFNEESIIYRHDYVHNLLILRATKSIPDTLLEGHFLRVRIQREICRIVGFPAIPTGKPQGFSAAETCWRRERDSNPRYPFGYNGFQDRLFQPLTHPSA